MIKAELVVEYLNCIHDLFWHDLKLGCLLCWLLRRNFNFLGSQETQLTNLNLFLKIKFLVSLIIFGIIQGCAMDYATCICLHFVFCFFFFLKIKNLCFERYENLQ